VPATDRARQVPVTRADLAASAKTVADMNLAELQKKLIAVARKSPPDDHVPDAFEKRVMTRLTAAPRTDEWTLWTRALSYGAAACAAVALCLSVWSFISFRHQDAALSFSQDLEQTILASAGDADNTW